MLFGVGGLYTLFYLSLCMIPNFKMQFLFFEFCDFIYNNF